MVSIVLDLAFLSATILFFIAGAAYVAACRHLQ